MSKNNMAVIARKEHECMHCGAMILPGRKCITMNPKFTGRRYLCQSCAQLAFNIKRAQVLKDNVAFGDDGAYLAYAEAESEAIGEFEEARNKYR